MVTQAGEDDEEGKRRGVHAWVKETSGKERWREREQEERGK
jgi:hypothetical protein